jgi:hypothetical protein
MNISYSGSSAIKYAASFAPYLAIFLLIRFAAEATMHLCMPLVLIFFPCLLLYIGMSLVAPFYAFSLVKKCYAMDPNLPVYSFTVFLFLFASLIVCLAQYIFFAYISPDYIDHLYHNLIENIQVVATTYPDLAASFQNIADTMVLPTPLSLATDCIWNSVLWGAVLGIVYAMVIRYKQKKNSNLS